MQVAGKVLLQDAPPKMTILVVSCSSTFNSPVLLDQIRRAFNTDRIIPSDRYVDYTLALNGQRWLLEGKSLGDIYIISPGYPVLVFDGIPAERDKRLELPDITLPKNKVEWEVPPPPGTWWFVRWVMRPRYAY